MSAFTMKLTLLLRHYPCLYLFNIVVGHRVSGFLLLHNCTVPFYFLLCDYVGVILLLSYQASCYFFFQTAIRNGVLEYTSRTRCIEKSCTVKFARRKI